MYSYLKLYITRIKSIEGGRRAKEKECHGTMRNGSG